MAEEIEVRRKNVEEVLVKALQGFVGKPADETHFTAMLDEVRKVLEKNFQPYTIRSIEMVDGCSLRYEVDFGPVISRVTTSLRM